MNKNDIIRKLTSRKLWVAVAGFVSGLILAFGGTESTATTVTGVILQGASVLGYLLAEGLADANSPYITVDGVVPTETNAGEKEKGNE